jgi:uncharacterized protein YndB with AHSA1/START domain
MTTSQTVVVTRTFRARPERVFAAFENAAELARWMGQPGSRTEVEDLDVRVGGAVRVRMSWESGMSIRLHGTFEKVEKPSLLRFTWAMEGDDANAGVVTVEIRPHGTGTELVLTHEGLTGPALAQAKAGWNGWLDRLEALLETG